VRQLRRRHADLEHVADAAEGAVQIQAVAGHLQPQVRLGDAPGCQAQHALAHQRLVQQAAVGERQFDIGLPGRPQASFGAHGAVQARVGYVHKGCRIEVLKAPGKLEGEGIAKLGAACRVQGGAAGGQPQGAHLEPPGGVARVHRECQAPVRQLRLKGLSRGVAGEGEGAGQQRASQPGVQDAGIDGLRAQVQPRHRAVPGGAAFDAAGAVLAVVQGQVERRQRHLRAVDAQQAVQSRQRKPLRIRPTRREILQFQGPGHRRAVRGQRRPGGQACGGRAGNERAQFEGIQGHVHGTQGLGGEGFHLQVGAAGQAMALRPQRQCHAMRQVAGGAQARGVASFRTLAAQLRRGPQVERRRGGHRALQAYVTGRAGETRRQAMLPGVAVQGGGEVVQRHGIRFSTGVGERADGKAITSHDHGSERVGQERRVSSGVLRRVSAPPPGPPRAGAGQECARLPAQSHVAGLEGQGVAAPGEPRERRARHRLAAGGRFPARHQPLRILPCGQASRCRHQPRRGRRRQQQRGRQHGEGDAQDAEGGGWHGRQNASATEKCGLSLRSRSPQARSKASGPAGLRQRAPKP